MTTRQTYVLAIAKVLMFQRPHASRGEIGQWACEAADVWLALEAKGPSVVMPNPNVVCAIPFPEDHL